MIDAVVDALSKAGYNNPTRKKVMIQSSSSAVLTKLKEKKTNYEFVYEFVYRIPAELEYLLKISILPQYTHPPLLHIQGIHSHIQKYECFGNERHRCKHMPAILSRRAVSIY